MTFQFTDTGSIDFGGAAAPAGSGVYIIEVWTSENTQDTLIGGAVVALQTSTTGAGLWSAVLSSAARATAPLPTFTATANIIRIATAGGSGHWITVNARRLTDVVPPRYV